MSSTTGQPGGAKWQPPMTQDSLPSSNNGQEEEGVTVKPMRLKVLYTFDDQNKTNCLARWPAVLQIRTVAMDETTTIGVIELKTCIQAIVQCSPELVAKLGQDYTVYAYDFSEYEVPLVGQGMLSWALAASSPTLDCPASESQKLITGRVCKNIQGLFSNGVKETLEVKLRLVPVPTVLQSEYLSSMEKYREVSRYIPQSLDQNEWINFLRSNPNVGQMANKLSASNSMASGSSHEVVNQLLSPSLSQGHASDPFNNPAGNEGAGEDGKSTPLGGRAAAGKTSRPSSRASIKRPRKPRTKSVAGGNTSGYEEGTDGDDGPPAGKKRAKIVQAEWGGKGSFGAGSDSLRVAASTTNSIRTFRPIAMAPAPNAVQGSHLQEIPRAPTPVPGMSKGQSLHRAVSQSNLRRDSIASQGSQAPRYQSPYSFDERHAGSQDQEVRLSIESAMTSPEKNNDSAGETPPDIASSPPVLMRGHSTRQSSPQAPSSPVLPQMPRPDSGFMSGGMDDMTDLFGDDEMRLPDNEDIAVAAKYTRRTEPRKRRRANDQQQGFNFQEVTPGPMELLPTKQAQFEPIGGQKSKGRSLARSNSVMSDDLILPPPPNPDPQPSPLAIDFETPQPVVDDTLFPGLNCVDERTGMPQLPTAESLGGRRTPVTVNPSLPPPSRMARTASMGSLTLPTIAASDPGLPPTSLSRSQTWSEAPVPPTNFTTAGLAKSQDAIAKKAAIRQRLEDAILRGATPPFCQNCGAIETPTWRKCFAQEHQGAPGYHEYSDEPGRVIAIDVTARDEEGNPTAYTLFKKSLGKGDDKAAFVERLLCNPCGIWLSKFKQHRPEDKWYKETKPKQGQPRRRGGGSSKSRKETADGLPAPTSEAYFQSDAAGYLQSDVPGPTEPFYGQTMNTVSETLKAVPETSQQGEPSLPNSQPIRDHAQRPRASSVRPAVKAKPMAADAAVSALRRAIQSSPARYLGSHHSPIEIEDEDLGNTRRNLFPSPRKDGSPKVLGELATNVILPITHSTPSRVKATLLAADKENHPPVFDDDDPLEKLIEQALMEQQRPKTPTPKTPTKHVFKTPTRPTPSHRPITRSQSRSARSYRHEALPQRTPSKTPSTARRRSPRHNAGPMINESPFTASLNKLLSEANNITSPSRHLDLGIEFSLPDLGNGHNGLSSEAMFHLPGFDNNQDFFSTDVPMPSSPPRLFSLYEDPMSIGLGGIGNLHNDIWTDFQMEMGNGSGAMNELGGLLIDENGRASFDAKSSGINIKKEPVDGADSQETA